MAQRPPKLSFIFLSFPRSPHLKPLNRRPMAPSATFLTYPKPSFPLFSTTRNPFSTTRVCSSKPISVKASSTSLGHSTSSTSLVADQPSKTLLKSNSWKWRFDGKSIKIYYEEHGNGSTGPSKEILMLPTISDVSTAEEWRTVAQDIVQRAGKFNWRATIVDWPGLGDSDRPKLDYNADVMEQFLVDFVNSSHSPVSCQSSENGLVIFGGGHAAAIVVRAAKKGLVKLSAIAAVAPTWSGPLPIVFGRDSSMENRYGFLRGTLRSPGIGWMMYNMLVSNVNAIQSQYKSHVYADPKNVTPDIVESRYALTKREGSRYAPAAFLTGLLDPVKSREEFVELFAALDGQLPILVVSSKGSPRRSKAEMEALRGAKGVSKFAEVPGALLPQEEYPAIVADELYKFLQENYETEK